MVGFLRVARNAAALLSADIIGRVCNAVLFLVMVNQMSAEVFGAYTTVLGFLLMGGMFAEFGIGQVLVREIAQNRSRVTDFFLSAILAVLPLTVIVFIGILVVTKAMGYPSSVSSPLFFSIVYLFSNAVISFVGGVLKAFGRMGILASISSLISLVITIAGILLLKWGAGSNELVFLFILGSVTYAILLLAVVWNLIGPVRRPINFLLGRTVLADATPLGIHQISATTLQRFDIVFLSRVAGLSAAGIYGAAVTIIETLSAIMQAVIGAAFPFMAIRWKESPANATAAYKQLTRFFIMFSMGAGVGMFFLADKAGPWVFRHGYSGSVTCLRILAWSLILNNIVGPTPMMLVVTKDRLMAYLPYTLAVAVTSAILIVCLVPKYGYEGASWVTVFVSSLNLIIKIKVLRELLTHKLAWLSISWRSILAAVIMGITLFFTRNYSLIALFVIGAITYILILVILGEFTEDYRTALAYYRKTRA